MWNELIPRSVPQSAILSVRSTRQLPDEAEMCRSRACRYSATRARGENSRLRKTARVGRCSAPPSSASIVLQRPQTRLLRVVGPAAWRRRADGPSTTSGSARLGRRTRRHWDPHVDLRVLVLHTGACTGPGPTRRTPRHDLEQRQVRVDRIGCPPPRSSARERPFVVMDRRACT